MLKKRIKIFTHTDLDGIGSVVLASTIPNIELNFSNHDYSNIDKAIIDFYESDSYLEYDKIFITDISVRKPEAIKSVIEMIKSVEIILLDHHETVEELNCYEWATVIPNGIKGKDTCGTELFYEYLLNEYKDENEIMDILNSSSVKEYVELTRSYDTWDWEKTNNQKAKDLNNLFNVYKKYEFIKEMVDAIKSNNIFTDKNIIMLQAFYNIYDKFAYKKLKEVKYCHINGEVAGVIFAENYTSAIAHDILNNIQIIDIAVVVNPSTGQVSFRSREGGPDVRIIAEERNGGGHTNASGCRLTEDFLIKIEQVLCEGLKCD